MTIVRAAQAATTPPPVPAYDPPPSPFVVLSDAQGAKSVWVVNLIAWSTDLGLQMSSAQLKAGMAHRPVRIQERSLNFTIEWPRRLYDRSQQFVEAIREHQKYGIAVGQAQPMELHYPAISKVYYGWIEQQDRGDQRFQVKYQQQYRMRLVNASSPTPSSVDALMDPEPYAPTAMDVVAFGDQWYNFAYGQIENPEAAQVNQRGASGAVGVQ